MVVWYFNFKKGHWDWYICFKKGIEVLLTIASFTSYACLPCLILLQTITKTPRHFCQHRLQIAFPICKFLCDCWTQASQLVSHQPTTIPAHHPFARKSCALLLSAYKHHICPEVCYKHSITTLQRSVPQVFGSAFASLSPNIRTNWFLTTLCAVQCYAVLRVCREKQELMKYVKTKTNYENLHDKRTMLSKNFPLHCKPFGSSCCCLHLFGLRPSSHYFSWPTFPCWCLIVCK